MRELVKKVGSLVLGIGALSLLLVNAAVTHGCSGARPSAPETQAGAPPPATPEPAEGAEPVPASAAETTGSSGESDCEEAAYMPATKAPVMPMRRCGKSTPNVKQTAIPPSPANNAQQQAP